jgi:hypothetical protein
MTKAAADLPPHPIAGRTESGNAFVIVMLGVVLFAALMFTFTRSSQQGSGNMTDRELQLTASDVTDYAQSLERSVNKVMLQGGSENILSFDNTFSSTYQNSACTVDTCKVFLPDGGAAAWENPPPGANDGSAWVYTGANSVPGMGDDATADLVAVLPNVTSGLCLKINDMLNVTNPGGVPPSAAGIVLTPFVGTFINSGRIGDITLNGIPAACVMVTAPTPVHYDFYNVLMAR